MRAGTSTTPCTTATKLGSSDSLEGPAIVEEPSSTTVIHAGDVLTVGEHGELVIDGREHPKRGS